MSIKGVNFVVVLLELFFFTEDFIGNVALFNFSITKITLPSILKFNQKRKADIVNNDP